MTSSSSNLAGRWAIVRGDKKFIYFNEKEKPRCVLGRPAFNKGGKKAVALPVEQQLSHPYISREHLFIEINEGATRLRVCQMGRNPTFWGSSCEEVPRDPSALLFEVDTHVTVPTRSQTDSGSLCIKIPPMSFEQVGSHYRGERDDSVLFFPDGVHLPDLYVCYEQNAGGVAQKSAAASTLSAAQMLTVSAIPKGESDEED